MFKQKCTVLIKYFLTKQLLLTLPQFLLNHIHEYYIYSAATYPVNLEQTRTT